ncbi:MAG: hypothetical protein JXA99_03630 [Candidatus Lokiarchaeota archaeon]|nr:hypothetical protein [Candidatus Lokiarchaeota archaeon]
MFTIRGDNTIAAIPLPSKGVGTTFLKIFITTFTSALILTPLRDWNNPRLIYLPTYISCVPIDLLSPL